jgi:hypothetical protein
MPESLTGSFDPDLLETTLNGHAADGSSKGRRVRDLLLAIAARAVLASAEDAGSASRTGP